MVALKTREYYLRTADFDADKNLSLTAIFDLFQDVAGVHAIELGCGYNVLSKNNLAWVLSSVYAEILDSVKLFDKVIVKTWPLKSNGIRYQRETQILNENGEVIVKGTSTWTIIDLKERKISIQKNLYPENTEFLADLNFDRKIVKIADFEPLGDVKIVKPERSDLDLNGHVNNVKYINFCLNSVNLQEKKVKAIQVDYHKEVTISDKLFVSHLEIKNGCLFKGVNEMGEKNFFCKIEF